MQKRPLDRFLFVSSLNKLTPGKVKINPRFDGYGCVKSILLIAGEIQFHIYQLIIESSGRERQRERRKE